MIILGQLFWTIGQGPQPGPSGRIGGDDVPNDGHKRRQRNEKRRDDLEAAFEGLLGSSEPAVVQRAVEIVRPVAAVDQPLALQTLEMPQVEELLAMWRDEQERAELMELLQILN